MLPASGCPRNFHLASFTSAAGYGCLGQKNRRAAALWRLGIGRGLLRSDSGSEQKLGGILAGGGWELVAARRARNENHEPKRATSLQETIKGDLSNSISGLVVEYIVAIDVTRARFPCTARERTHFNYWCKHPKPTRVQPPPHTHPHTANLQLPKCFS